MKYAKNKLSHYRGRQSLRFLRSYSKLEEHSEDDENLEAAFG
jgi:hypothetical protein